METMKRNLPVFLGGIVIIVLVVIAIFVSRDSQTEVFSVPGNWKMVNLDGISLLIPPSMKPVNVTATDLGLWKYHGTDMQMEVQYGATTTDPGYFANQPEYLEEPINTEGGKIKVVTFKLEDSKLATFSTDSLRYVTAARIVDEKRGFGTAVTIWITCLDKPNQELAKKVVGSVRFK